MFLVWLQFANGVTGDFFGFVIIIRVPHAYGVETGNPVENDGINYCTDCF